MSRILIADDEHSICRAFSQLLLLEGHTPLVAGNGREAIALVRDQHPDAIFLDVMMPLLDGIEALKVIHREQPQLPVIIMTAHGTMETAMDALHQGAFDYLGKPVELEQVREVLRRALHRPEATPTATADSAPLPETETETETEPRLVGRSAPMQELFKLMGLLAGNELTVLVSGESGTGKELVARGLHDYGPHREQAFIAVNCAAIPEQLLESELFGHERGAFTGATARRIGRIEAAANGTLFLDEIGELPPTLQGKLLRVLQERSFERVGSQRGIPLTARVIAATNRSLEQEMAAGRFREDLFHRLNLVNLQVPPLRKRREDIPLLARHFLRLSSRELGKDFRDIEAAALQRLQAYQWPGNVRELEHSIKRSVLLARGPALSVHDLRLASGAAAPDPPDPPETLGRNTPAALGALVRELLSKGVDREGENGLFHSIIGLVERELIAEALSRSGNNQVAAARLLGINRTTLRNKMQAQGDTNKQQKPAV